MSLDPRIDRALKAARDARESEAQMQRHLAARNAAIMELRADDPVRWTYKTLADALDVSVGLIAKIVQSST
jgi:hypothetical protein